ncbi:hypothetical protein, partial [Chryseobacterium sp. Leaf394]|uniref:hypothetical protein n=1 Tax=Chryseobacterium sp. Leaf394 TaxID=1736361 RepID=UPI0019D6BFDA
GLGEKTEFVEQKLTSKTVSKLHIKLEDWLGDDLMECYPCYLITENLKENLKNQTFTGYMIEDVEISMGEYFFNNYNVNKSIPKFYWLKINGDENKTDLYIGKEKKLFCSEKLLNFLTSNCVLNYLKINPERNEFDDLLDQMIAESKKK